jgi:hypothetical protein
MMPKSCTKSVCEVVLLAEPGMIRRGERSLEVPKKFYRCVCRTDPDTGEPLEFVDQALWRANQAEAARLWEERFGEPLPEPDKAASKQKTSVKAARSPTLILIRPIRTEADYQQALQDLERFTADPDTQEGACQETLRALLQEYEHNQSTSSLIQSEQAEPDFHPRRKGNERISLGKVCAG